jgi:hypothetical protein
VAAAVAVGQGQVCGATRPTATGGLTDKNGRSNRTVFRTPGADNWEKSIEIFFQKHTNTGKKHTNIHLLTFSSYLWMFFGLIHKQQV